VLNASHSSVLLLPNAAVGPCTATRAITQSSMPGCCFTAAASAWASLMHMPDAVSMRTAAAGTLGTATTASAAAANACLSAVQHSHFITDRRCCCCKGPFGCAAAWRSRGSSSAFSLWVAWTADIAWQRLLDALSCARVYDEFKWPAAMSSAVQTLSIRCCCDLRVCMVP
jgi:hypothetical protein